jgi:hypothetical protein
MLDSRTQQPVEVLARDQQVLKLVEDDERRSVIALPQCERQVQERQQHGLSRGDVRASRTSTHHNARTGSGHRNTDAAEHSGQVRARPRVAKSRVCLRDAP